MESIKPPLYGVLQLWIETKHSIFGSITRTGWGCGDVCSALRVACSTTPPPGLEPCLGDHFIAVLLGAAGSLMWETGFNCEQTSWK